MIECDKNCTWCDRSLLCEEKFDIVHNTNKDDNKKDDSKKQGLILPYLV